MDTHTTIRLAKLTSITPGLLLTGYAMSISHSTLPALLDHKPQTTVPILASLPGALLPFLTILSGGSSAYLAWALPEQRREWAIAAAAMLLTIPFRGLTMLRGEQRLIAMKGDERMLRKSEMSLEHRQIMVRLGKLNWIAVGMAFASGVVGLMAVI